MSFSSCIYICFLFGIRITASTETKLHREKGIGSSVYSLFSKWRKGSWQWCTYFVQYLYIYSINSSRFSSTLSNQFNIFKIKFDYCPYTAWENVEKLKRIFILFPWKLRVILLPIFFFFFILLSSDCRLFYSI